VNSLLTFFIDLAFLKRKPQDLPSSVVLLVLTVLASFVLGVIGSAEYYDGLLRAAMANALDAIVVLVLIKLSLSSSQFSERFLQTATAMFGASALFGGLLIIVDLVITPLNLGAIVAFASIGLLIWVHMVMGFILQNALEKERWAGVIIAVGFTIIALVIVNNLVPPASAPSAAAPATTFQG